MSRRPILLFALIAAGLAAPGTVAQCIEPCVANWEIAGTEPGEQFGWNVTTIGDLDGDAIRDFIVASPFSADGGRISVRSGATGRQLFRFVSPIANAALGYHTAPAGDVNGDGTPDLIIGSRVIPGTGRVYVLSGVDPCPEDSDCAATILHTFTAPIPNDEFGVQVSGNADFDGDGVPDIAVGAPSSGRVHVYSGATGGVLTTIAGGAGGFGWGVTFTGDVTGDGRDELVVAAPFVSATGRAIMYRWTGTGHGVVDFIPGPPGAIAFGLYFMDGRDDVTGDGVPDLLVNAYQADRAYVFSGADGNALHQTFVGAPGSLLGYGEIVDDLDGDGVHDLLIPASNESSGAPNGGRITAYRGTDGSVIHELTWTTQNESFGSNVDALGDIDGDGTVEYVVGINGVAETIGRVIAIAPGISPCAGDLDGDHTVTFGDVLDLLARWGACANCAADLDGDGAVGFGDLLAVLTQWGPCPIVP